ncbi:MAG: DNA cytosine methyltransferase [Oscillospiraceae bacterium]|nr:DNA cytosine methyltransferase [Oscillospiraceae bacterium]
MNILLACEESQRVTIEMRRLGHTAFSCDLMPCSGGYPEWHIQSDVLPLINGNCEFTTMDGALHSVVGNWDMLIAFPPCTYLTNAGTRHFSVQCNPPEKVAAREKLREAAAEFFLKIANADCDKIAVENPVGYMSRHYKPPTQIIEPYYFAESVDDKENYVTKRTCLWLKGLPPLKPTADLPRPKPIREYTNIHGKTKYVGWCMNVGGKNQAERAKRRSKTFFGVAKAMAEQWAGKTAPVPSKEVTV